MSGARRLSGCAARQGGLRLHDRDRLQLLPKVRGIRCGHIGQGGQSPEGRLCWTPPRRQSLAFPPSLQERTTSHAPLTTALLGLARLAQDELQEAASPDRTSLAIPVKLGRRRHAWNAWRALLRLVPGHDAPRRPRLSYMARATRVFRKLRRHLQTWRLTEFRRHATGISSV